MPRIASRVQRLGEQRGTLGDGVAAGRVERAGQQRRRRSRLDQRHAAVDQRLVQPAVDAEVQHRRLREAADDLVRARDDQVSAEEERVRGQLV
jgi:hypothetical protein